MNFFSRLFESAEAREQRRADESKENKERAEAAFWLSVVFKSGMEGSLTDHIAMFKQRFPGAYEEYVALLSLQAQALQLAQAGIATSERKARLWAFHDQFVAELAAKAKG